MHGVEFISLLQSIILSPYAGKTRETGLLNAYFSAGAIYALAEDCRVNDYDYCTCTRSRATDSKGKLVYTDCAADYDYAYRTIQEFIIDILDAVSLGGKVDKHNVELGAKVIGIINP